MDTTSSPYPAPQDTIIVHIGTEDREIFMSFGLIQTLAKMIGPVTMIERIPMILIDPAEQETFLREVLVPRSKSGKVIGEVMDLYDYEISMDDVDRITSWTVDHLVSFFVKKLKLLALQQEKLVAAQEAAQIPSPQSPDGSLT